MIKTPTNLQELRRKIYVKAKAESREVLAGSDGVGKYCTKDMGYTTISKSDIVYHRKSNQCNRSHKF